MILTPISIILLICNVGWKFTNLIQRKEKTSSMCTNKELIVSASYDGASYDTLSNIVDVGLISHVLTLVSV